MPDRRDRLIKDLLADAEYWLDIALEPARPLAPVHMGDAASAANIRALQAAAHGPGELRRLRGYQRRARALGIEG